MNTIKSIYGFKETVDKVRKGIQSKGFKLFAEIDHGKAAAENNVELRPTCLFIFGNPKVGTLLMRDKQSCGIDLPVKILVWEDKNGNAMLTGQNPLGLKEKHGLGDSSEPVLQKINSVISGICSVAAGETS